ncbi:MAG: PAS domain-containing protein [Chlamydiae bacterium]|nr:PAS domain-containing protein [Chlamydiota bacterium]MBI3266451.1 PAS domain-containing protein [Chlamydiota bacterium]
MVFQIVLTIFLLFLFYRLYRSRRLIQALQSSLKSSQSNLKEKAEAGGMGQAKLDAVLSSMFEGVLLTDPKGRILFANPSFKKIFMMDTDPYGKSPLEMIRNVSIQNIVERTLGLTDRLITEEVVLTHPEEKFFKVNAVPVVIRDEVEGAILVFHDITELRRLEKVRQDFVANVSHELRTPLSSIKGYVETLLDGAMENPTDLRQFLQIVSCDSNRLSQLVDDLLDLARMESGKVKMVFLPVDMRRVIQKAISILEQAARAKTLSVNSDLAQDIPQVLGDEVRLSQVMVNLLDNAIKYTPEKGRVTVCAFQDGDFLQVNVKDTGIGIPPDDQPRIFERFYRVDKSRSREVNSPRLGRPELGDVGGTGLGLSIVKHIVQAHKGEVWVQSQWGRGSTFGFTVPFAS